MIKTSGVTHTNHMSVTHQINTIFKWNDTELPNSLRIMNMDQLLLIIQMFSLRIINIKSFTVTVRERREKKRSDNSVNNYFAIQ